MLNVNVRLGCNCNDEIKNIFSQLCKLKPKLQIGSINCLLYPQSSWVCVQNSVYITGKKRISVEFVLEIQYVSIIICTYVLKLVI